MTKHEKTVNDAAHRQGGAARHSEANDASDRPSTHTGAGQEAGRGGVPEKHTDEHQSNYGGGGTHGGSK
jgi:hypothetical protein